MPTAARIQPRYQNPAALGHDTVQFSGSQKAAKVSGRIHVDPEARRFRLTGKNMEYQLQVNPDGELLHLYWGKPVGNFDPKLLPHHKTHLTSWQNQLDVMPREMPDFGRGDNRTPAVQITTPSGQVTSRFRYKGHRVIQGKPSPEGLPGLYADRKSDAQTLVITMRDEVTNLDMELFYTVFRDQDVIVRSARLTNNSGEPVKIDKLASFAADFDPADYQLLKLSGSWARERQEERMDLKQGAINISSRVGASGHEHNPFVALLSPNTTEETGDVYGVSLVYSGSFSAEAEQNRNRYTRLVMGLNPASFEWTLAPGESFQTPEAVGVFSAQGLGGMSRALHKAYKKHLIRGEWQDKPRPILLNSWEAAFFDLNHDKLVRFAEEAKAMGVDLVVVDDGWFGDKYPRNDGTSGLGDWMANPEKFPRGMDGLAEEINALGLDFGIWVEPEMVNPNSELYEKHPDWVIHQPGRDRTEMRHQLVLDLGRKEVQDYIIESMSRLLESGRVKYVKWDMNRTMTEIGSAGLPPDRQKETQHRYMLGLYRVMETLTQRFPGVLWEGCAGGGGRFDPGMLAYFPQTWTSDNSDGPSRLRIQAGTVRAYPPMTMGAHVTDVPNTIIGRTTSLKFRFHVAMAGNLGLELDPTKLSGEEKAEIRRYLEFYRQIRHIVQDGEYHLLSSPADRSIAGNWPALAYVLPDQSEALVFAYQLQADAWGTTAPSVKLKGLDPEAAYRVSGIDDPVSGAFLMNVGLNPKLQGDYDSEIYHVKKIA